MREKGLLTVVVVLMLSLFVGKGIQAGTKDMVAGKRVIFRDDSVESMRDVFMRRETESKEYKKKILSNGEESIKLLKEIRDLLQQLNKKKE